MILKYSDESLCLKFKPSLLQSSNKSWCYKHFIKFISFLGSNDPIAYLVILFQTKPCSKFKSPALLSRSRFSRLGETHQPVSCEKPELMTHGKLLCKFFNLCFYILYCHSIEKTTMRLQWCTWECNKGAEETACAALVSEFQLTRKEELKLQKQDACDNC